MEEKWLCLVKRYLFLCIGLTIMAFGVACSIKAGLGTSPISSVPYVLSLFTPLSVGTATIAMHCVFIAFQILLLRKNYHPIQLVQLPAALVFGALTDVAVWTIQNLTVSGYLERWILCLIGILLVGVGVSFEVAADVVTLAGEGVVLAVCRVGSFRFSNVKIAFDVTLVGIACVLSVCFLGRLAGVREGTVAAAILVGVTARQVGGLVKQVAEGWFSSHKDAKTEEKDPVR